MLVSDISVQGVAGTLLATDEMLETITVLKTELQQRAQQELKEIDRRRQALLELIVEQPARYEVVEKVPRSHGSVNPPKYRNPENPLQVWSGRGKKPNWVIKHLAEPANLLQDLLIP